MEKTIEKTESLFNPEYKDCIRTYTGKYIDIFDPKIEMIDIVDIAHSLAMQCRFNGHTARFYSVAQHSVLASNSVSDKNRLAALLHDSAEAYLCDIPSPFKRKMGNYYELEDNLTRLIGKKYGFEYPFDDEIKQIDNELLQLEWDGLMVGDGLVTWDEKVSKEEFLRVFERLKR